MPYAGFESPGEPGACENEQQQNESEEDKSFHRRPVQHAFQLKTEQSQAHHAGNSADETRQEKIAKADPGGAHEEIDQRKRGHGQDPHGQNGEKTVTSRLMDETVEPRPSKFVEQLPTDSAPDTITDGRAQKPSGHGVRVTGYRPESENRRDSKNGHGKKDQASEDIDPRHQTNRRRVAPHGLLPGDNCPKIDPLVERRPAPERGNREQNEEYQQQLKQGRFTGISFLHRPGLL